MNDIQARKLRMLGKLFAHGNHGHYVYQYEQKDGKAICRCEHIWCLETACVKLYPGDWEFSKSDAGMPLLKVQPATTKRRLPDDHFVIYFGITNEIYSQFAYSVESGKHEAIGAAILAFLKSYPSTSCACGSGCTPKRYQFRDFSLPIWRTDFFCESCLPKPSGVCWRDLQECSDETPDDIAAPSNL